MAAHLPFLPKLAVLAMALLGGALLAMIVFGGWDRYFPNFKLR